MSSVASMSAFVYVDRQNDTFEGRDLNLGVEKEIFYDSKNSAR